MIQYLDMLDTILHKGYDTLNDRTGTGTRAVFGYQLRFDLQEGFPLVTTKKVHVKSIIHEALWMLRGDTNIKYLVDNDVKIWSDWPHRYYVKQTGDDITVNEFSKRIKEDSKFAAEWGCCGPIYGRQWRHWPHYHEKTGFGLFDQLQTVISRIKTNPTCRRLIISAWNAPYIEEMAIRGLPPCHFSMQYNVRSDTFLDCHMNLRSADAFLGTPFNIAQYSFILSMIAQVTNYKPGHLIISFGNCHLYLNHLDQAQLQLQRKPYKLPTLKITKHDNINDYVYDDFEIVDYTHHPRIKADISV